MPINDLARPPLVLYLVKPNKLVSCCFFAPCSSVGTHPTANSQRSYIRDAHYTLKFADGISFDYTSLTDVEVVNTRTNGALLIVEVICLKLMYSDYKHWLHR